MLKATAGNVYLGKRRRYGVGRYIRKKYGYSKPYRRLNKYSKGIVNNLQTIVCTDNDKVILTQDSSYRSDNGGGTKFRNLRDILQGSSEFQTRKTQYNLFKITGLGMKFTRRWINPISFGVEDVSPGIVANTYQYGFPMLVVNFFPTEISSNHGIVVEQCESSFNVSPFITALQKHYIRFPQMITGNGIGLNMWNPTNLSGSLIGQISYYNDQGCVVSNMSDHFVIWDVEYAVYVQFCNNTGT